MKKIILALTITLSLTSCSELLKVLESTSTTTGISQTEAISGLKQALEFGVNNGTSFLGKKDGFLKNAAYKILMSK